MPQGCALGVFCFQAWPISGNGVEHLLLNACLNGTC